MIATLWPQPDAGSIVEPEPASGSLFLGYFEPLTAPDRAARDRNLHSTRLRPAMT
jgi:hypothetical protein